MPKRPCVSQQQTPRQSVRIPGAAHGAHILIAPLIMMIIMIMITMITIVMVISSSSSSSSGSSSSRRSSSSIIVITNMVSVIIIVIINRIAMHLINRAHTPLDTPLLLSNAVKSERGGAAANSGHHKPAQTRRR